MGVWKWNLKVSQWPELWSQCIQLPDWGWEEQVRPLEVCPHLGGTCLLPSTCCTCWGAQVTVASRLRAGEELPVECGRVGTKWNSLVSALNHHGIQRGESSNASLLSSKSYRFHFCSNNPEYKEKILGMWLQLSRVDTLHSSAWLIGEKRNPMKNSLCTFSQSYIECLGCYFVFQDFSIRCVICEW